MEYGVYIAAAALFVTIVGGVIKIMRAVRDLETSIRVDMEAHVENLAHDVLRLERESVERAEIVRREFGEMGSALRTKIHEVEVYTRDTFVRQDGFEEFRKELREDMRSIMDKLDGLKRPRVSR